MEEMFLNCKNLSNIDISSFDTKNVKRFYDMFDYNLKMVKINDIISNKNLKERLKRYGCNVVDKFGNNIKI